MVWALTLAAVVMLVNKGTSNGTTRVTLFQNSPDWLRFTADWTLFLAKLTAAATAALGIAGYLLMACRQSDPIWLVPTALLVVLGLTLVSQRLSLPWLKLTLITLATLFLLILFGIPAVAGNPQALTPLLPITEPIALLQATALMTVAYAEIPHRTTERAIERSAVSTALPLLLSWLLYTSVAIVSVSAIGVNLLGSSVTAMVAPLALVMQHLALPGGLYLIAAGAIATMAGEIILLLPQLTGQLLDLSQTVEQADHISRARPSIPASISQSTVNRTASGSELFLFSRSALMFAAVSLGCILLMGDIRVIWSFSAFALLLHHAINHWVALRLRNCWFHGIGLGICLLLAFQVVWSVWLTSLGLVGLGIIWRGMMLWANRQE
jgi:APA family basic amino acid/polyamine antiporter